MDVQHRLRYHYHDYTQQQMYDSKPPVPPRRALPSPPAQRQPATPEQPPTPPAPVPSTPPELLRVQGGAASANGAAWKKHKTHWDTQGSRSQSSGDHWAAGHVKSTNAKDNWSHCNWVSGTDWSDWADGKTKPSNKKKYRWCRECHATTYLRKGVCDNKECKLSKNNSNST